MLAFDRHVTPDVILGGTRAGARVIFDQGEAPRQTLWPILLVILIPERFHPSQLFRQAQHDQSNVTGTCWTAPRSPSCLCHGGRRAYLQRLEQASRPVLLGRHVRARLIAGAGPPNHAWPTSVMLNAGDGWTPRMWRIPKDMVTEVLAGREAAHNQEQPVDTEANRLETRKTVVADG